jgi:hypothetical protein
MNLPTTPQRWLVWVHQDERKHPVILAATAAAIGDLSVLEAHAGITIRRLSQSGPKALPLMQITQTGGRNVQISLMGDLRRKGYVTDAPPVPGWRCSAWMATVAALDAFAAMETRLEALIAKAQPVAAVGRLRGGKTIP